MPSNGKSAQKHTDGKPTDGEDWRHLAERATEETDPEKLLEIIEQLCGALELREAERQAKPIIKKNETSVDG